ncbi:hypothetical protein DYY67_0636 [Candidatus Nitrosotalea sp. TS]|uniref:hypothetical protein n=1 Tax=Candidatus Nitrosotalea sp. TS TaxID=2341020 RepID=UPI0015B0E1FA|nr:hypothetical protein [Candidatus Nitrosotalea sp. TS]NHI02597.1 hypothetical protein [Candidatus Nitrosotalea sp. TS]
MISAATRSFIDSLVDYYISEAASYKHMAKAYADEVGDVSAAAFGIHTWLNLLCIYPVIYQSSSKNHLWKTCKNSRN